MPIKYIDIFKYKDRVNRTKHISLYLFWILLKSICDSLQYYLTDIVSTTDVLLETSILILLSVFQLIIIINYILLNIRRLHDFNFRGWWLLLSIIPIIGYIWYLIIFFIPGNKESNRFGSKPIFTYKRDLLFGIVSFILIISVYIYQYYHNEQESKVVYSEPRIGDIYIIKDNKIILSDSRSENMEIIKWQKMFLQDIRFSFIFNYYIKNYRAIKINKIGSEEISFSIGNCTSNDPQDLLRKHLINTDCECNCRFCSDTVFLEIEKIKNMIKEKDIVYIKNKKF
ncbi:MAG: DUF805 domain-containing protein [Legionellales bacterium]|nr:DUF805 domain-containing protein [Legionellales bacterium]